MRLSRLEVLTLVFVISVHLLAFLSSFLQFSNPPKKIEDVLHYGLWLEGKLVVTSILVYEHASLLE